MRRSLTFYLPEWAQDWLEIIVPGGQIVLILLAAWLLQNLLGRLLTRAGRHYQIPLELQMPIHGLMRWTIFAATLLLVLERLGVSATVLWTGFTGFATVGAVAFFAAWSVLSNLFCAFLIFTVGPFRLGDTIELLDTAEKPGAKGRVVDINLLYTTLEDATRGQTGVLLQIPNALIFQRVLRRWEPAIAPSGTPAPAPQESLQHTPSVP
jgi:small-conductance mechanosensitive channel